MIDLRRLEVLRMLDEQGTVTATAEALYLTPSAVSQQLRQLASDVGSQLLQHEGRCVRLTPAARLLLEHANAIYTEWEQARASLAAHAEGACGKLRLYGFATAFGSLLVPAATRLRKTNPSLEVNFTEADVDECRRQLLADRADLAVLPVAGRPPLDDPRFDQEVLLDDPQELVVSADHPLAGRKSVRLVEAARETWIAPHHDQHQLLLAACTAAGFAPRVEHSVSEWSSVLSMVEDGFGVCLLPRLAAVSSACTVVRIPLSGQPTPARSILTCVRQGSRHHPVIAQGLEALAAVSRRR